MVIDILLYSTLSTLKPMVGIVLTNSFRWSLYCISYVCCCRCREITPTDDNQSRHAIGQNADILAVSGRGQDGRHLIVSTPVSLLHSNDTFQWLDTVRAVLGTSQRFRRRGQSSKNSHHRAGLHMQNIFFCGGKTRAYHLSLPRLCGALHYSHENPFVS